MTPQHLKAVGLAITAAVGGVATLGLLKLLSHGAGVGVIMGMIVAAIWWLTAVSLCLALVNSVPLLVTALGIPAVVAVALGRGQVAVLVGAILYGLATVLARGAIIRALKSSVRLKPLGAFRFGTSLVLWGMFFLAAGLGLPAVSSAVRADSLRIPEATVAVITAPIEKFVVGGLTDSEVGTPTPIIDAYLKDLESNLPPGVTLDPATRSRATAALTQAPASPFAKATGGKSAAPVASLVTLLINDTITTVVRDYPGLTVAVAILIAVLAARVVIPVIVWPTLAVIVAVLTIARRVGFVHITSPTVPVERLAL